MRGLRQAFAGVAVVLGLVGLGFPAASAASLSFPGGGTMDLGGQSVGTRGPNQVVEVLNDSGSIATIDSVGISGPGATSFAVGYDTCDGRTLAGGQSCWIGVNLFPAVTGPLAATVEVESGAQVFQVSVTGTGIPALTGPTGPSGPTGTSGPEGTTGATEDGDGEVEDRFATNPPNIDEPGGDTGDVYGNQAGVLLARDLPDGGYAGQMMQESDIGIDRGDEFTGLAEGEEILPETEFDRSLDGGGRLSDDEIDDEDAPVVEDDDDEYIPAASRG